ncbi:MAG: FAD-binding oxidoreductase [Aurantimicrobium sp.]|nr:FAD-binding oxidoreductase [Aurantimicrobium sp.]
MDRIVFERNVPARDVIVSSLADSVLAPFWLDTAPPPAFPRLENDISADLLIVGGGYTGLWSAVRAKERNPEMSVVLIEMNRIGWAASGRNGGFCEASLTHGRENGLARWPEEFDELERLGHKNLDEIEETIARYNMDVEFERTGTLSVATEPHQIAWVSGEPESLTEAEVRQQINSPTYLAGSWEKTGTALIHPAKLVSELARVATELGVLIFEQTPADTFRRDLRVVTPRATVTAKKIILATNAYPSLLKRNALMTVPVYDYVLTTEPLSAKQMKSIGWSARQGVSDLSNQFHYYRLTADNRILFGGYDAVYYFGGRVSADYEDRRESFELLASHFFTTFPQLAGAKFTHRWAGPIDSSSRFCAFFGTARKNRIAYALGFTGLGVGATRFAADVMLDRLDGIETERTRPKMVSSRPTPFPPEPLASVGINLVRWSMNRADHNRGKRNLFLRTLDAMGMGFDS